ncbi:MAG: glycosyltransferase [Streptosporangiaceae bacterium]
MTAVIVAHDGATWLPKLADALLGQTRPVQRVVAVDTGSRDRSGAVLSSKFGQPAVFGMDRSTGYGVAISRALHHRAANAQVPRPVGGGASSLSGLGGQSGHGGYAGDQSGDRIEWLWLLHDDCEPAPDALEQLLRGTVETSTAAVLGPKLRDWTNRDVIQEAGLTLDTVTRRLTGIEPREVDQGQHDGDRDALAVSSAGMLVRRDVWEQVGGFDPAMGLFMDDIDFCWRVHAAGYRVRVITDAIVYHVQAATKHRRSISVGRRARMLDRRNGLLTLLGNLPFRHMVTAAVGNFLVSLLRITFFLLAKRLAAAMDEMTALTSVLCHPFRLIRMRSARAQGRRAAFSRVRADVPSGRSARRLLEFMMSALSKSQPDTAGAHHATDDPTEDDSMLIDNGLGRRLLTSPSLLAFVLLLGVALAAGRSLLIGGPLGGGSVVPAWGGASDLWGSYLQSFHPAGIGSTTPAPAWLAVVATLSTVLAGKPWLAIDVLLIGCVPLAGMTAMLAVRKVTTSAAVRVWASVTYGLLPVATGVIASGRFGTAVAFVLLPLIVAQASRMLTDAGARATRAAWATGLLVAIAAAFVPLLWVMLLIAGPLAAIVLRNTRRGLLRRLLIAIVTPPVLLLPWSLTLISHPARLFLEAGLPQQGTPIFGLPARSLMLLSPGGPGMPPYWVTGGLIAVAFAALFAGRRRRLIIAGWGLALTGLLAAVIVSHLVVQPDDGSRVAIWAGLPLALAAIGLLIAAAGGADALGRLLAGVKGWRAILSGRGPWAALLALIACSSPALAAAAWLSNGVAGPVHPVSNPVVPELVAVAVGQARQVRTLVLSSEHGHVSYLLLRGPSPSLADAALTPPADAQRALSKTVSALTTPTGVLAANQAQLLADFDIGFILVQSPVDRQLATVLNNVSGLRPYSSTSSYSLWQLNTPPSRVSVVKPDGTVVPVPSGPVGVSGASVPAGGGTLMLAEPAGGWKTSLNGQALSAVPSPAGSWAQAYRLPAGGGTLTIAHPGLTRDLLLLFELLAFLVVASLALPGIKVAELEAQIAATASVAEAKASGRAAGRRSAGRTSARSPASPAVADLGGSRGEPDDATALVPASERAELAAEGRAGASGLSRGARARAGRARAAASSRAGRNRSGRAAPDGSLPGADAAIEAVEAAGLAAADGARRGQGHRRGAGHEPRDGGRRGRTGPPDSRSDPARAGDRRSDGRLAEAWPYAPPDDRQGTRADGGLADAWPYAAADEGHGPARSESARPYAGADEPRTDAGRHSGRPRAGQGGPGGSRSADPLTGEWSQAEERDLDPARDEDYSATGLSGWPSDPGERGQGRRHRRSAAGQSPSGRSPAGDWPYAGLDAEAGRDHGSREGRSASGPSAAGSWPYSDSDDFSGRDREDQDIHRSDPYRQDPYESDRARAGRHSGGPDRGRSPSTRSYKINELSSPSGLWPYDEPDQSRDPGTHRRPERESGTDWDLDSSVQRRTSRDTGPTSRVRADQSERNWGGDPSDTDRSRSDDDQYRAGRARSERHDSGRASGRRARSEREDGGRDGSGRGRSGGRGIGRRSRRGGDDQPASSSRPDREEWQSPAPCSAWSGGDDELEPLPPLDGPGQRPGRRLTWQSADDSDWGRLGDSKNSDPRWADPLPDFEPEYEGDSW